MVARIVSFALSQRFIVIVIALVLMAWGAISFRELPIEAYPNLSPPHVEIITQWPGHAAEEVERLITIPIEIQMNGIPKLASLRSLSMYGLSAIEMNFQFGADPYFVRELAFERVGNAAMPAGVAPSLSPLYNPSGLIYRYVVKSPDRTEQQLKTIQDWVLARAYRAVPGVADDSGMGGTTMQYQVLLNPNRLLTYGLSVQQVTQQLAANNANSGGGFYQQGGQMYYIRGLGLARDTQDIGNIVLATRNGTPLYVRDVGKVQIGHAPRLGQFGYMHQNDAVEGVIMMRVQEQAQTVLKRVEQETANLNNHILPRDVKVVPYYDRTYLLKDTTKTVENNLVRGIILVLVILGLMLFSVRTALIVAVAIPFSLLFAFICLNQSHIPANLLSIGAIDFGILVGGAVMMVENIFRELAARHGEQYHLLDVIRAAAREVERPIFYTVAVIIAGYIPIYVLTGPAGRLFRPMADTMIFALVGSLLCALTVLPVLCAWFLRNTREPSARIYEGIKNAYGRALLVCMRRRWLTVIVCVIIFGASLALIPGIGAEFMPHLDEGAIWIRTTAPYTISFKAASEISPQVRDMLMSFPQVTIVANELGRPDDGTDPTGFYNNEYYVGLHPYDDAVWKTGKIHTKKELIAAIGKKLSGFPGIIFNFTQPAEDAVDEAETGLKSLLAVKIFGSNLQTLSRKAHDVETVLHHVRGITDVVIAKELGQPSLIIKPNRAKIARYGMNVSDVNALIETALGGTAATQVIQGEEEFDLVVRMQKRFRDNENAIKNLLIATPGGQHLPLSQFASIHVAQGATLIYRQNNSRYIGVQFSVEGRDLASAVGEARRKVAQAVRLPVGYHFEWGGEYKEYVSSMAQMKLIVPLVVLLILFILFALYGNLKFPLIILFSVLLTLPVGGLIALKITGTTFNVSSMLGFVALMGLAVQTSVILYSYINQLRTEGKDTWTATFEASVVRLRPIVMTAMVDCLGLLPAAISTGIGSDSQKPFAIVIVGGMISRLFISIFLAPVLYLMVAKKDDVLKV
ncbi:MAG: efflux RND transporter permease subunit [Bryobacteraceae bacterium]